MQRSFLHYTLRKNAKADMKSLTWAMKQTYATKSVYDPGNKVLPTSQLLFDIFFYGVCCQSKLLTQWIPTLAEKHQFFRHYLLEPIFKHFIFRKFAGGENLEDCLASAKRLQSQWDSKSNSNTSSTLNFIIDEAAEDLEGESAFEQSLQGKLALLAAVTTSNLTSDSKVGYIPLKCSSLFPGECLEILTLLLNSQEKDNEQNDLNNVWKMLITNQDNSNRNMNSNTNDEENMYTLFEKVDKLYSDKHHVSNGSFLKGITSIEAILTASQASYLSNDNNNSTKNMNINGVSILLDAEMSHRQPAIDCLYRYLALRHNKTGPVIFNTYQCYLRRAESALLHDLVFSQRNNIFAGVKLVRGAYLFSERQQQATENQNASLLSNKEDVDRNYDTIAKQLVSLTPSTHEANAVKLKIMFATHNRRSVAQIASHFTQNLGLSQNHPTIAFAQILGMADMLTIALSQGHLLRENEMGCLNNDSINDEKIVDGIRKEDHLTNLAGFSVSKLLLYGRVEMLLPWLLRRLQENQDVFGAMQEQELKLLKQIFKQRFF